MGAKVDGWGRWAFPMLAVGLLAASIGVAAAQSDETVDALNARVEELHTSGKNGEAISIALRAVELAERQFGPDHPQVAQSLEKLASLYYKQGRHAEAEPLYRRALLVSEKALGGSHVDVGTLLNNLGVLLHTQGRYGDAEPLFKRALSVREKALGPGDRHVGTTLNNLAVLYAAGGRYAEAEAAYRRSLAIREKASGPDDPSVGESLNNLAMLFESQGRYDDAEPLLLRSLAIRQKAMGPIQPGMTFGPASLDFAVTFNNLAALYHTQGRYAEAEQAFKVVASLVETILGPSHSSVATALNNLAEVLRAQGRLDEAKRVFRRALSIWEGALGPAHPLVAVALDNLGLVHQAQRSHTEAERSYRRGLGIREKTYGSDHPAVTQSLNNLAVLAFMQRDWSNAAEYWRRSTSLVIGRMRRGISGSNARPSGGSPRGEVERSSHLFWSLAKALHRLARNDRSANAAHLPETFEAAQWAMASKAGQALSQMAARGATGDSALAAVVRERQDLIDEWQRRDATRNIAVAQPPEQRDSNAEAANLKRLVAIDARVADIDRQLEVDYPDYASLAIPAPLSVEELQAQLRGDEALVLFLSTPELEPAGEETFVWIVTKSAARWIRSNLGSTGLAREVQALRCGLDAAAWDGPGAERCTQALDIPPAKVPGSNEPLPFDHARAHKLYMALFSEARDLIKGKHLLIVPSGPLTQLPFHVLVTEGVRRSGSDVLAPPSIPGDATQHTVAKVSAAKAPDHRTVAWFARGHAVTILPAVASLKALRRIGRPSAAPRPMIGFGNPLLDGPDARYADRAELARAKERCPEGHATRVATRVRLRGIPRVETRGGLADASHIKRQVPLPETADELCAVAQDVKAGAGDIRLGAQATEREVKHLSASGELARYRIVHFATHGALAGELGGTHEPGLILTPPETVSESDDGYLSASEIAGLKLDADWVILSACNTAAGVAENAEALSGLARAFIYAQARALLVSHWAVDSDATVKLVTTAVREMARNSKVGRAEAMRRAMLALIDKGTLEETHPAYWAPFVVVGEGAPAR